MFRVSLRSFSAFLVFNNLVSGKRLAVLQWTKSWASGGRILCTFDCLVFKVILKLCSVFSIFDNLASQKGLVVEQNRPKFGPLGNLLSVYVITDKM